MPAGVYDFEVEQGASFKPILQWKNKDTGVPYNITGCEIRMQVRKAQQQPVLLEVTTTNGKFVSPGGPGSPGDLQYRTSDPWPTALPGNAV